MFCINCGTKIEENDSFCINCGKPVTKGNIQEEHLKTSEEQIEENNKANILCILSLLFTYGLNIPLFLYGSSDSILSDFSGLSTLIGLILMSIARVKYPNNKFAKIIMWIYIISIVGIITLLIVTIITCYNDYN